MPVRFSFVARNDSGGGCVIGSATITTWDRGVIDARACGPGGPGPVGISISHIMKGDPDTLQLIKMASRLFVHELREFFTVDNERIYDPHDDVGQWNDTLDKLADEQLDQAAALVGVKRYPIPPFVDGTSRLGETVSVKVPR